MLCQNNNKHKSSVKSNICLLHPLVLGIVLFRNPAQAKPNQVSLTKASICCLCFLGIWHQDHIPFATNAWLVLSHMWCMWFQSLIFLPVADPLSSSVLLATSCGFLGVLWVPYLPFLNIRPQFPFLGKFHFLQGKVFCSGYSHSPTFANLSHTPHCWKFMLLLRC